MRQGHSTAKGSTYPGGLICSLLGRASELTIHSQRLTTWRQAACSVAMRCVGQDEDCYQFVVFYESVQLILSPSAADDTSSCSAPSIRPEYHAVPIPG